MTATLDRVLAHLKEHRSQAVNRLKRFLAIPSVSTDPTYASHVQAAADWAAKELRTCGLDARVLPTEGHPVVLATSPPDAAPADAPRVLFYGHYDVQPPDPLDKWTTPPFEPHVRDGAIYARGACDDKGQVLAFIESLRAWKQAHRNLPCRLVVLLEGEEEIGSPHLPAFLEAHQPELEADFVLISDTSMWDAQTPAITYALRGLAYFDIQLHGPSRDLHSGVYGGALANPATILAQILGRLFDSHHRLTIPGFYDDVEPLTEEERSRWAQLGFDEDKFLNSVGIGQPFGESGYTTLERRWSRPSCDINGLYGGYGGQGAKTIIPSFAGAKVSFRLAPRQDPDRIAQAFQTWLRAQPTHGLKWKIIEHGRAAPVAMPTDSPWIAAATRALQRTADKPPVLIREGATIPVVAQFKSLLGLDSLLLGFGLDSDGIHSPNEHFGLDRFHLACQTHAALLHELARKDSA